MRQSGIGAFLEILAQSGVRYLFGNPGTTELPLNDALVGDDRFRYIFGLQEIPVVAMADGYAMASGHVGVANVHIACGLGNGMGMLYNAFVEGTPLLLTAGQQDRRLRFAEPVLDGDLLSVVRPWTKWAAEVQRVEDVPSAVRRALQTALTPPTGPVFLSLPVDVQMEQSDVLDLKPAHIPDMRVRPPREALERAAAVLASAKNPVILAGSRVTQYRAVQELVAVAERLGAPVLCENTTTHGRLPIPADHPLYAGIVPYWSPDIVACLQPYDVALVVGMNMLRLYIHHEPECPVPDHLRLVHLDSNSWEIGKNFPVEVGLIGDPACGLAELDALLAERLDGGFQIAARRRIEQQSQRRSKEQADLRARAQQQSEQRPMTPLCLMSALADVLSPHAAVVEEAITTHGNVLEKLGVLKDPTGYFAHRGWALGWGLGCAMGVKLAWPDRPVIGLLGDGAALYGIQGLWTAAHHNIPVTFIICNNAQYKILKVCASVMPLPNMAAGNFLAMDMTGPEVDFVGLANSFGVEACRVTTPEELRQRVSASLAARKPQLIEVPISRE